jgi:hypothetical protein
MGNPIKKTNKKARKGKTTRAKAPIKKKCNGMLEADLMKAQEDILLLQQAKELVDDGNIGVFGACAILPDIQDLIEPYDGDIDKALEKKREALRVQTIAFYLYNEEDKEDTPKKEEDDEDGPAGGVDHAGEATRIVVV